MKICYEGEELDFDLEEITVRQAMQIKMKLGLTLAGLDEGLAQGDAAAMLAVFWLMKSQGGKTIDMDSLDFKVVKLANAIQEAVERENAANKQEDEVPKDEGRKAKTTTT